MRFVNGLIVGFLLAIGVAFWHDKTVASEPDAAARQVVNWDAFGRAASEAGAWVQAQIGQLGASLHHHD